MNYWLVKSEPETYSWDKFCALGRDKWDGVRNFQARNNLKMMQIDDLVFFYHSVSERCIVGIAKVVREAYPDPTDQTGKWVAVDLEPVRKLKKTISLEQIKSEPLLQHISLIRQSRLSVMPLKSEEFELILHLSEL